MYVYLRKDGKVGILRETTFERHYF